MLAGRAIEAESSTQATNPIAILALNMTVLPLDFSRPGTADGVLPPAHQGHMVRHFHGPIRSAVVTYNGGRNSRHQIWVCRYRRANAHTTAAPMPRM